MDISNILRKSQIGIASLGPEVAQLRDGQMKRVNLMNSEEARGGFQQLMEDNFCEAALGMINLKRPSSAVSASEVPSLSPAARAPASAASSSNYRSLLPKFLKNETARPFQPEFPKFNKDEKARPGGYRRHSKSLGLLALRFVHFSEDQTDRHIWINRVAEAMNVSRRRIYDVANVLESLGVIFRKRKNLYIWMGFGTLVTLVNDIRKGKRRSTMKQWSRNQTGQKYASASFAILSQSFVDLLISSQGDGPVPLESAADRLVDLPTDNPDYQKIVKSKTRRLYDVANVLISLELIQKCETVGRRPAYFWIFRP